MCYFTDTNNKNCFPSEIVKCSKEDSTIDEFLMCPSTCPDKSVTIFPDKFIEFKHILEITDIRRNICTYQITASMNVEHFTVIVGHEGSNVHYTLFVKEPNEGFKSISTKSNGEISVYCKFK